MVTCHSDNWKQIQPVLRRSWLDSSLGVGGGGQFADDLKVGKQKSLLALKSGDLGSRSPVTLNKSCSASEIQFPYL